MKEKPIIFSTPMVQALLNTKPNIWPEEAIDPSKPFKWMTRRVIKPQPVEVSEFLAWQQETGKKYQKGDILWVRETFTKTKDGDYIYRSDPMFDGMGKGDFSWSWTSPLFLPRKAARILLEVKDVRIERLQDITEEDAKAEGVAGLWDYMTDAQWKEYVDRLGRNGNPISNTDKHAWGYKNYLWHGHFGEYGMGNKKSDAWKYQKSAYDTAKGSFSSLWELINAERGYPWDSNPWVWVYEFMKK
jgi:hypothetical protein